MTTGGTSRVVRWLVIGVLSVATAGMIAVSLRANYLFGYGFGQTQEKAHVFGFANVAADLWKVAGLIVITALWRARQRRSALTLIPIWMLCLAWGLVGAVGIYAQDRTAIIGTREATAATYGDVERDLRDIDASLQILPKRSVAQIDAAIEAILTRPVSVAGSVRRTVARLSAACTRIHHATADACAEIIALREERAGALEAERLRDLRRPLQIQLLKLREGGGALAADPVAELFAWLSRGQFSVRDVAFGFPLFFAVLIEVVSAFGPVGVVAYAEATRPSNAVAMLSRPVATSRDASRRSANQVGAAALFMADRTEPTTNPAGLGTDDLFTDYQVWCLTKSVSAASREEFLEEFDRLRASPQLGGKIKKFGSRYFGIALVESNLPALPDR